MKKPRKKSMQWYYEEYTKRSEHHPVARFKYKDAEVYISEGGPYFISDFPLDMQADLKKEFESHIGWYEATYALGKDDDIILWQPVCFDFLHDTKTLTENGRLEARIAAAVETAQQVVDENPQLFEVSH